MKRFFLLLLCLCMVLPAAVSLSFLADAASSTSNTKISVEKLEFIYGEPIIVTPHDANGGTAWVGIAPAKRANGTDRPISEGSVRWKYVTNKTSDGPAATGKGVNVATDIRTGKIAGGNDALGDIGIGEWHIFWAPSGSAGNYDPASVITITVTAGPMTTDKLEYRVGEPINVTATMAGTNTKTWYGIVPDENGAPKYSFGTILWHELYKALPDDGSTTTTHNLRNYTAAASGKMNNASLVTQCAAFLGVAQRGLFSLPAGTYWIVYCSDSTGVESGNAVTYKIQIKIKPCIELKKTTLPPAKQSTSPPMAERQRTRLSSHPDWQHLNQILHPPSVGSSLPAAWSLT